jgi:hypothetical protein
MRGGKHVGVDALSSGTRDQRFLALRIAALEQHLASGGKPRNSPSYFGKSDFLTTFRRKNDLVKFGSAPPV